MAEKPNMGYIRVLYLTMAADNQMQLPAHEVSWVLIPDCHAAPAT